MSYQLFKSNFKDMEKPIMRRFIVERTLNIGLVSEKYFFWVKIRKLDGKRLLNGTEITLCFDNEIHKKEMKIITIINEKSKFDSEEYYKLQLEMPDVSLNAKPSLILNSPLKNVNENYEIIILESAFKYTLPLKDRMKVYHKINTLLPIISEDKRMYD